MSAAKKIVFPDRAQEGFLHALAIQHVSAQDRDDHQSVDIPVYTPTGIFTPNHPDFGKPNIAQAEMCLDRIESEKKRIGGILKAISAMAPQNEVLESLIWAAYKLHEDETPLANLRKALCLPKASAVGGAA